MSDPLAEVIAMLNLRAVLTKTQPRSAHSRRDDARKFKRRPTIGTTSRGHSRRPL